MAGKNEMGNVESGAEVTERLAGHRFRGHLYSTQLVVIAVDGSEWGGGGRGTGDEPMGRRLVRRATTRRHVLTRHR